MFNLFRKPVTVYRRIVGDYVASGDGLYTESFRQEQTLELFASIQPATGKETGLLPEGRRGSESYTLYTDDPLFTPDIGQNCDQVLINAKRFDVLARADWQNNIINHYKYVVTAVQE